MEVAVPEAKQAYFITCGGARDKLTGKAVASFEDFGAGQRLVYVSSVGRLWVHLLCPSTLNTAKIRVHEWPASKPASADTVRTKKIIRATAKRTQRLDMPYPNYVHQIVKETRA